MVPAPAPDEGPTLSFLSVSRPSTPASASTRLGRLAASFSLAAALAACGGGGGGGVSSPSGSPPPPPPPPAPAPVEAAYLVAGTTAAGGGAENLWLFDPDHPSTAVATRVLGDASGQGNLGWLTFVPETTLDATAGTVTTRGNAMVAYVDQGHLWAIDLRGNHDHAPRPVGAFTDVCAIDFASLPLSRDGQDAWLAVRRVGPGSGCSTPAIVRTTGGTSAATSVPPGSLHVGHVDLGDDAGLFAGVVAIVDLPAGGSALVTAGPDLATWTTLADASALPYVVAYASDRADTSTGWLSMPDGVHRTAHGAGGVVPGALVHPVSDLVTALATTSAGAWIADGAQAFFADGAGLDVVVGTAPARDGPPPPGLAFLDVAASDDVVWFASGQRDALGGDEQAAIEFVDAGGAFHVVDDSGDAAGLLSSRLSGMAGGGAIVIRSRPVTGWTSAFDADRHLGLVDPADGSVTTWADATAVVSSATTRLGRAADLVATLDCPVPTGSTSAFAQCAAGDVVERSLAGDGVTWALGRVDTAQPSYDWTPTWLVQGVAVTRTICVTSDRCELFMVTPGQAASLVQLTHTGG